jgi:hypothetical protein
MNYKFKLSRRLATLWTGRVLCPEHMILSACLAVSVFWACTPHDALEPDTSITQVWVTPDTVFLQPGTTQEFTSWASTSDGSTSSIPVVFSATGGTITSSGQYTAGADLGHYQVVARAAEGLTGTSLVMIDSLPPTVAIGRTPQWTVRDDGVFIDAENSILHLKFAYNASTTGEWFKGGGGRDGGIVELYYKPTSTTRNLVFRNGAAGGKLDNLDYFQAEDASTTQADHNTMDFSSGVNAQVTQHRVWESAGRLFAEFDFDFKSWRIKRTYVVYPWGDITVHARISQIASGSWSYMGHSFHFAVSTYPSRIGSTLMWGSNYQADAESYYAWSDGYGPLGQYSGTSVFRYQEVIRAGLNKNTAISMFGRLDPYSGFMLDDRNGNDPDIIVMNGDSATWFSPFDQVSRAIGGKSYVEAGIFTPTWARGETHASMNWFYNTTPCCPVNYASPMLWPTSLGTWNESFHLLLRRGLTPDAYLPLWEARVRYLGREAPFAVTGAQVRLDPIDRLYHFTPLPGASGISFQWRRYAAAPTAVDYRTAFVIDNFANARSMSVSPTPATLGGYQDPATGDI